MHRYLHSWIVRPMSLDLERAPGLTARMENTRTDPQTTPAAPADAGLGIAELQRRARSINAAMAVLDEKIAYYSASAVAPRAGNTQATFSVGT